MRWLFSRFYCTRLLARKTQNKMHKQAFGCQKSVTEERNWNSPKAIIKFTIIVLFFFFVYVGEKNQVLLWREGSSFNHTSLGDLQ